MKNYFCIETDEQVNFGDELHLTFFKNTENGKVTVEKGITLTEDTLDWMIKMGFIEEREVEEEENNSPENDLLDFGDETPCEALEALEEDFERLEEKVERLETLAVGVCKEMVTLIKELLKEDKEEKKNAQPKKK